MYIHQRHQIQKDIRLFIPFLGYAQKIIQIKIL